MTYRFLGSLALMAFVLNRKSSTQSVLPSVKGVIEPVHSLPGRLRLHIPSLINNPIAAETLSNKMGGVAAIESVQASPQTGSVLIHFDPAKVDTVVVFGATARVLGIDAELGARPQPLIWKEFKAAGNGINDAIYHGTAGLMDLKTLVGLGLVSTLAHGFFTRSLRLSNPGALTLGWWAYQLMFWENQG